MNDHELLDRLAELEKLAAADLEEGLSEAESRALRERARFVWAGALEGRPLPVTAGDRLRRRFFAALERELENAPGQRPGVGAAAAGASRPRMFMHPAWWAAAALVVGFGLGWLMPGRAPQTQGVAADLRAAERVERLEEEVRSVGQLLTLTLLEHSSASERLRGIELSEQALGTGNDDAIVEALLVSVVNDPSENVRLAAVDVLGGLLPRPQVRSGLAKALPRQRSPMLQVALGDVLSEGLAEEERVAFEQVLERPSLDPLVRERLEEILGGSL